jgi:hypothetical protein
MPLTGGGRAAIGQGGNGGKTASDDAGVGQGGNAASDAGHTSGVCGTWEACSDPGARSNVCGGVIADARHLIGTGFEQFEGARVVSHFGHATIQGGGFDLHVGNFAGCFGLDVTYRIDVSPNGHCDDGVDLVYRVQQGFVDLVTTGEQPGVPVDCTEFPNGYDLDLTLTRDCFANCGALRIALLDAGGTPVQFDPGGTPSPVFVDIYLADTYGREPFIPRQGVGGLLAAGSDYLLRYYWTRDPFGGPCQGTAEQVWEHPLTAAAGVNAVMLRATPGATPGACF